MRRLRHLRLVRPETQLKHPLRDTIIVYGAFSILILILGTALGRGFGRTLVIAALVFVVTTIWSMYRLRRKRP